MCDLDDRKTIFPVVESEINCASDGLVETTKISLPATVAHNCHIKTKCSQQITNRSHQIQIAHSKFKLLTANSNRSQQIQIAHSKFKSFTAN